MPEIFRHAHSISSIGVEAYEAESASYPLALLSIYHRLRNV
ncbi:hypothetical protein ACFOPN_04635 [Xanthomonas hyacinthi]